jgi:hypothetical protein
VFDEGNYARRYWQVYFPAIGWSASRRDRKEDTAPTRRKFRLRLLQIVSDFGSAFFGNVRKMQIGTVQTALFLAV